MENESSLENINYKIIELEDNLNAIVKKDSPNIRMIIKRGFTVTSSQLKKFKDRTIFIDGVFKGPPFVNNERQQYSLDHHEGVIRNFTLSSCEQALIMIMKGLTLDEGKWDLYVNEPDLDAVLSLWVLSNYKELIHSGEDILLQKAVRLVRVEGIIDVHGFTLSEFTGYASSTFESEKVIIEKLIEQERELKASGMWTKVDFTKYTMLMLSKVDIVIYGQNREKKQEVQIEELKKITMLNSKYIIICQSPVGIYEVEGALKDKYPGKVGIIILKSLSDPKKYTVRLSNEFITPNLNALYHAFNKADKNVKLSERHNKWGGSDNIGGSPQQTGSELSIAEIERICRKIYCKQSFWEKLRKGNISEE